MRPRINNLCYSTAESPQANRLRGSFHRRNDDNPVTVKKDTSTMVFFVWGRKFETPVDAHLQKALEDINIPVTIKL